MYYGHMGYFGGFGMLLFWGLFVWLVIWLIKQNNTKNEKSSIDIIKVRYAKGEITKKEYEDMKKQLI